MLKKDIQVGGKYVASVNGVLRNVRVDAIRERDGHKKTTTVYDVTNLATGRKLVFRSAVKFRWKGLVPSRTYESMTEAERREAGIFRAD